MNPKAPANASRLRSPLGRRRRRLVAIRESRGARISSQKSFLCAADHEGSACKADEGIRGFSRCLKTRLVVRSRASSGISTVC